MPEEMNAEIARLITSFFEPWGSWKTAWWEGEVGDEKEFSAENLLREILRRVEAAEQAPSAATTEAIKLELDTSKLSVVLDIIAGGSVVLQEAILERLRQVEEEGFTREHDDEHVGGELACAAACYATHAPREPDPDDAQNRPPAGWPWEPSWWRPKGQRRDLVRAIALLVAEVERIDRAAARVTESARG